MTDSNYQPPDPEHEVPSTDVKPTGKFEVAPSGGASWLPLSDLDQAKDQANDQAKDQAQAQAGGGADEMRTPSAPESNPQGGPWNPPAGGWSPHGGAWIPSGAAWNAQGGGWVPPHGGGWMPPAGGWSPQGGGWMPPGSGWNPPPPPGHREKPHRRRAAGLAVTAAVVVLVAAGAVGYAVRGPGSTNVSSLTPSSGLPIHSGTSGTTGTGTSPSPFRPGSTSGSGSSSSGGSISSSSGSPSDLSSIASGVDPSLVDINTIMKDANEEAAGTGMVLTSSGEVLTNNHVIEESTTITATDLGNGKTYTAKVVGYDHTIDVAVIQLQGASGLKTVSIGNSSTVAVGEAVVGIGNAGGVGGTPSVAGGSVTALNQSITASDSGDGTTEKLNGMIETNCNIQPGDSGGPLVNAKGQVLGMDTAASESSGGGGFSLHGPTGKTASATDQGYSIPINTALTLAKKIEAGTSSSTIHIGATAFLGVEITIAGSSSGSGIGRFGGLGTNSPITSATGPSTTPGVEVAGVVPGTPATGAGIVKGDVITTFAGQAVATPTSLTSVINGYHPGNTVKVTWVTTSGRSQSATVTLASGPAA